MDRRAFVTRSSPSTIFGLVKEALAKVYGLLSHTGGHPYMAQNDQARLLRHLALTFSQFAMLRLRGKRSK
jgi:hypothetical protein